MAVLRGMNRHARQPGGSGGNDCLGQRLGAGATGWSGAAMNTKLTDRNRALLGRRVAIGFALLFTHDSIGVLSRDPKLPAKTSRSA
jgi:hypothetical protein